MRGLKTEVFAEMWEKFAPRKKDVAAKEDWKISKPEAPRPGMFPSEGSLKFGDFSRRRGMGKADL